METSQYALPTLLSNLTCFFSHNLPNIAPTIFPFRKHTVEKSQKELTSSYSCIIEKALTLGKSLRISEVFDHLIAESQSWSLPISEACCRGNFISLKLSRDLAFRSILSEVYTLGSAYGKKTALNFIAVVKSEDQEGLTGHRLRILANVARNLLSAAGYHVVSTPSEDAVAKLRLFYSTRTPQSGATLVQCNHVITPTGDRCQLSVEEYQRLREDDMRAMSEHKYWDPARESTIKDLADAAVAIDLLQMKASYPVRINTEPEVAYGIRESTSKGGTFLVYNYARLAVIQKKFEENIDKGLHASLPELDAIDTSLLSQPEEWQIVFDYLLEYPNLLAKIVEKCERGEINQHVLCSYLFKLCHRFSVYYRRVRILQMDWVVFITPLFYLLFTPYTKVEESFNVQAVHDLLYHGANISAYDHHEFPGVVPRTFIGPLFLAFIATPFVLAANLLGLSSKFFAQYIVRAALATCVSISLLKFQKTLGKVFGGQWSWWYSVVTVSQFHVLFYSSRPLPNILVLPLVLLALSYAFTPQGKTRFLLFAGAAIVFFRAELMILLGIILLMKIYDGYITMAELMKRIIPIGVWLVCMTFIVDTFFWQRPVWPEAEVFYFNVILDKSSEWGTSPFLWYFYSALPRGLGVSLFLIPVGLVLESRIRRLVLAALTFILLFSFLPHKELRFIIYTYPILNIAVAAACHRLWENRNKSPLRLALALGVVGHIAVNLMLTSFLLMVARVNYPGGEAIARLHQLVPQDRSVFVHIGNLAAQTGVSRFTEINQDWRYSKDENLEPGSGEMLQFTHLLVEAKSKYSPNLKPYAKTHNVLASVEGFSEVVMNAQIIPPVRIKTKPLIFILERKPDVVFPVDDDGRGSFESKSGEEEAEVEGMQDAAVIEEPDLVEESSEEKEVVENVLIKQSEPIVIVNESNIVTSQPESIDGEQHIIADESDDDNIQDVFKSEPADVISNILDVDSEDDLLADESNKVEETDIIDYQQIVDDLEQRLSSHESEDRADHFHDLLADKDILNDIKELTKQDFGGLQPDLAQLKQALKKILEDLKEHKSDSNAVVSNSNIDKVDDDR